jgi:hypothetical protein
MNLHLKTFFLLIFYQAASSQIQLTNIISRQEYENVQYTEIDRNNHQASIFVQCVDGGKLFYFSDGVFTEKQEFIQSI